MNEYQILLDETVKASFYLFINFFAAHFLCTLFDDCFGY